MALQEAITPLKHHHLVHNSRFAKSCSYCCSAKSYCCSTSLLYCTPDCDFQCYDFLRCDYFLARYL